MSYRKIIFILCLSIFLSAERNANAQLTFNYTGSVQAWSVPCNVTSITIDCYGAQGVGINGQQPGYGGEARGVMSVVPGDVLYLYVGGQAAWNGGGVGQAGANGGDGTDVRYGGQSLANRIIVAGGGGGAGGSSWQCTGGVFGNGGGGVVVGSNFVGGGGGEGYTPGSGCGTNGGNTGGSGGNGCYGGGGGGGGKTSGGIGAQATCNSPVGYGDTGKVGLGGAAYVSTGCTSAGTGGGGGGYYGGGGAAGYSCGAGQGGGGSSWTGTLTSPYFNYGAWTGKGKIVIATNNVPTPVTDTAVVVNNATCNGGNDGKAAAHVTGGLLSTFTFSWAPAGGSRDTATGLSAGTYTVTATDACAISATSKVTITQPLTLGDTIYAVTPISCHGESNGSAEVGGRHGDISSSYTYQWTPTSQTTALATGLSAGVYTVVVTDLCGGSVIAQINITQPNPLAVSARATANISCYEANDGIGTATVNSGTPPYTYSWAPTGGNTSTAMNLSAGTYSLNVSDARGCTGSAYVIITQPSLLTMTTGTTANVVCNGLADGGVSSNVNGGTIPYTYAWTGGGTTAAVNGLTAGTYTLNLTDAHGCTLIQHTTITQPAKLVVVKEFTPSDTGCSGSTWAMANGGVLPYTYLWTNGNRTAYNYGVCDSTYCCKITDAHGCDTDICATVNSDLGMANVNSGVGKITVYPNPSNGMFTIMSSVNGGQWSIEVYNVLGEEVYTQSNIQNPTLNLNLSGQPNGIYLYRVISSANGNMIGEGKMSISK